MISDFSEEETPERRELFLGSFRRKSSNFLFSLLTNCVFHRIIHKLSGEHAAVAQSVERILGKDEVTSSNLVSSSNIKHLNLRI